MASNICFNCGTPWVTDPCICGYSENYDFAGYVELNTCCPGDNGRHSDECPTMFGRVEDLKIPEVQRVISGYVNPDISQFVLDEVENDNIIQIKEGEFRRGYQSGFSDGFAIGTRKYLETHVNLTPVLEPGRMPSEPEPERCLACNGYHLGACPYGTPTCDPFKI